MLKKGKSAKPVKEEFLKKVFISHSSKDKEVVTSFIQLLEVIGIDSASIFCSSLEGYGTTLGNNFIEEMAI